MNLKIKTIGIVAIVSLFLVISLFALLRFTTLNIFLEIEENKIRQDTMRIILSLENEIKSLEAVAISWAEWDDTYLFVKNVNQDYIKNNLVDTAFYNQKIDTMIFLDINENVVFSKSFVSEKMEEIETPLDLIEYIDNHKDHLFNIERTQSRIGYIKLNSGIMMISVRPITTSKIDTSHDGYLLVGRYLGENEIANMQKNNQIFFSISDISPYDINISDILLNDIYVKRKDMSHIEAHAFLKDIHNEPISILKISSLRDIFAVGLESLDLFLYSLIVVILVFYGLMIFLLDKMILKRIQKLTETLHKIINNNDLSQRAKIDGRDEITYLALTTNKLLNNLKETQEDLKYASCHDSLTGLLNRNSFEEEIKKITEENNTIISIVVCDVDGLKIVNDQLGHSEGDKLLKLSADIIKQCFRSRDKIYRIGGDEFVVILPTLKEEIIKDICHRVENTIKKHNENNPPQPISISIGYAINSSDVIDMVGLFKEADDKMYDEKYNHHNNTHKFICSSKNDLK